MRPPLVTLPSRLSDQALRRLGTALSLTSIASALIAFGLMAAGGLLGQVVGNFALLNWIMALLYGLLGLLLLRSEIRNPAVWLLVGAGIASGFPSVLGAWWDLLAQRQGVPAEAIDSSGWPPGLAALFGYGYHLWPFSSYGVITLGLLLTPDGRLVSRRWLPVAGASILVMVVVWLNLGAAFPIRTSEALAEQNAMVRIADAAAFFPLAPLSLIALVLRYRRAEPALRRRLRWVLYGGMVIVFFVTVVGVGLALAAFGLVSSDMFLHPAWLFAVYPVLAVSYAMAIWRNQLFDIDLLIARTLLYGSLAAFIGGVYVGLVFGVGSLLGQTSGDRPALSLAATVAVAFLFQPVRRRMERVANRLVYGRRASPYEVLADLSARLRGAESSDGLLGRMVTLVAEATGAERAVVWRRVDSGPDAGAGRLEPLAVWPAAQPAAHPGGLAADEHLVPIERAGKPLGALGVTKRAGDDMTPTERRLLNDLAGSAGLVLDRVRLDAALAAQADALARSRRRLVDAQSDERQRLERQLDEGTQRHLVSLAAGLDDGGRRAVAADLEPVGRQLEALAAEIRTAGDEIAALARGMYPLVLESDGLVAAVVSLAAGLPIDVTVEGTLDRRLDRDVELAVYFSIAEALTNVVKHADASSASVRVDRSGTELRFEVVDDGRGFEVGRSNGSSTGLVGLRDRMDTVGGAIAVRARPGAGTIVAGSVPVPDLATVGAGGSS